MEDLNIYIHASRVAEKPGMFMINKVEELYLYLLGFHHGKKDGTIFFDEFNKFVNEKHGMPNQSSDWCRLIRFYSSTDYNSIELFRLYLDEFILEQKNQ